MAGFADIPPEILSQLSVLPETPPEDFTCAICGGIASNRCRHSPREFQRPPVCISCENISGYAWNGAPRGRTKPTGGFFRDRRAALQIAALADAIGTEATITKWRKKHDAA